MSLYKLSFKSKEEWLTVKESLKTDGMLPNGISIALERHLSYSPTLDSETGEVIIEGGLYDNFSVDIFSYTELPQLNDYIMPLKDKYRHNFCGISNNTIVMPY